MRVQKMNVMPAGQKVTEKYFRRVLISSVCSILLCMASLVGTTWAWYTVSIENTGNVIQIADLKANVAIENAEGEVDPVDQGGYILTNGSTYSVSASVEHGATQSDLPEDKAKPAYIIMTLTNASGSESYYCMETMKIDSVEVNEDTTVSFEVSWAIPSGSTVAPLEDNALTIGEPVAPETTAPEGETNAPSAPGTEPAEATDVPAGETTIPAAPEPPTTEVGADETIPPAETTEPIDDLAQQTEPESES